MSGVPTTQDLLHAGRDRLSFPGCRTAGIGCLDCKKIMIKHVIEELAPFREKRARYEKNPDQVEAVLTTGNAIAHEKAAETMVEVREAVGL